MIEDCAQSVGASYKGRPVGSMGAIGIYSLQLNKTITAGEGGAVVTNDPILFERATRFHDVGALRAGHEKILGSGRLEEFTGCNFRMNEFSGGVLLAQLRKLDRIVADVRKNAQQVYEGVRTLPGVECRYPCSRVSRENTRLLTRAAEERARILKPDFTVRQCASRR